MKTTRTQRDGTVVIAVCVSLVGILGFLALSLDGGAVMEKRRSVQGAADAAALAAAAELYARAQTNPGGLDEDGSIALFAKTIAADNGYTDLANGVTVSVSIPPATGAFVGMPSHVEVVIAAPQARYFSRVFGPMESLTIKARAVGRGRTHVPNVGIMALHPTMKGSFSTGGGGSATLTGGAKVIVNSNNAEAMIANGNGTVSASQFDLGGTPGYSTPGGATIVGKILSGQAPQPDPLRFVPVPDPTTMVKRSDRKIQKSNGNMTLRPGVYEGGISATANATITLEPGVYYMKGGGFSFSGGSLEGTGVMIYNDPESTSDVIDISGGSNGVKLSPPADGPYRGINLFQRRDSDNTMSISGNGSGALQISGTFYAAGGTLKATGNGSSDTIGSQYISNIIVTSGNGSYNVSWDPNIAPAIRQLYLVE